MPSGTSSRALVPDWADLDSWLARYVANQYVPTLQQFAQFLITSGRVNVDFRKGERKEVLLAKINEGFRTLMRNGQFSAYQQIRAQCEAIGRRVNSWNGFSSTPAPPAAPPPTFGGVPAPTAASNLSSSSAASVAGSSRYQSSAHRPWQQPTASSSTSGWNSTNPQTHTMLDWKPNPMFKAIKALTSAEMLPDIGASESSHTNRRKQVTFYLPQDVVTKLQQSKTNPNSTPRYGLRVFCTSSEFYRPPGMSVYPGAISATNRSIPMEYPSNPDFAFEGVPLAFRERGLRGKPGSAPPFDLGRANITLVTSRLNTLTMGHTGPTVGKKKDVSKRFYFQVVLAEIVTKDELLDQLLKKIPTSITDSLAAARSRMEDDDIVAESSRMTLKDPLSYMRITQPIRSTVCTHIQCFDAKWWIEGNSQHPQFLCPLCNKSLRFEDLIVDGYFLSILDAVPDSVEEVIVDTNFEWATEDGKYSSVAKEGEAASAPPQEITAPTTTNGIPPSPSETPRELSASPKAVGKRKAIEILSSDDEDEQPLSLRPPPVPTFSAQSRPAPLRTPSASASVPPSGRGDVIDLTLSDSEDEADPPPPSSHQSHFHLPGAATIPTNSRSAVPHFSSRPVSKLDAEENSGVRQDSNARSTYNPPLLPVPQQLPDIDTSSLSPYGRPPVPGPPGHHEDYRRLDPDLWRYDRYRDSGYDDDRSRSDDTIYENGRRDGYSPPRFGQHGRYGRYSPPRLGHRSNDYDRQSDGPNKRYRASEWMREDIARGYGAGDYNSRT